VQHETESIVGGVSGHDSGRPFMVACRDLSVNDWLKTSSISQPTTQSLTSKADPAYNHPSRSTTLYARGLSFTLRGAIFAIHRAGLKKPDTGSLWLRVSNPLAARIRWASSGPLFFRFGARGCLPTGVSST
jgi:hypothetical protein